MGNLGILLALGFPSLQSCLKNEQIETTPNVFSLICAQWFTNKLHCYKTTLRGLKNPEDYITTVSEIDSFYNLDKIFEVHAY